MTKHLFEPLQADLQVQFWTRLSVLQDVCFASGLAACVEKLSIADLDRQLLEHVGSHRLSRLARYGVRGEVWFPVPCVLETKPSLIGYYRLLYGLSQKDFYSKGPFGRFKSMEDRNTISKAAQPFLISLCTSLGETGWNLLTGIDRYSPELVRDLQVLTLGPQLRGGRNNTIGQDATRDVFTIIREIAGAAVTHATPRMITLTNAAGRTVHIEFASDPDIGVIELAQGVLIPKVAMEIKGGGDRSNVHNRIGEAEKSHQKARLTGYSTCWTIVNAEVDLVQAGRESPSTNAFFRLSELRDSTSPEFLRFRELLRSALGVA